MQFMSMPTVYTLLSPKDNWVGDIDDGRVNHASKDLKMTGWENIYGK